MKNRKSQRIEVRTTERQELLIKRAADATDRSLTEFIIDSASVEAERVLADRRWFLVDEEGWKEFNRLLDEPLQATSKLESLANRTTVFDRLAK